jgi:O-methyltransferase
MLPLMPQPSTPPAWKKAVNDVLRRTTGYQLERAFRPEDVHSSPAARRAGGQLAKPKPKPGARRTADSRAKSVRVPGHYDERASALIRRVTPRTMTSPVKLFSLVQSIRYVVAAGVAGDVVECGVWRGGSMQAVAWTLLEENAADRDLYLFDTFEGMPPPGENDKRIRDGSTAEELLQQHRRSHPVWAYAGLDDVREGMNETGYPVERTHFVQGLVEDTIPSGAPERIAVLRLDTDWYASTRHELEHLYPRLVPGGVLILDDYGHWDGARKATEEYLASIDDELLLLPISSGRIAVKPHSS